MVGDGDPRKTGELGSGNSAESEAATPSSRRSLALVATGVGEHTDSLQKTVQPGGNALRAALEQDVHRFHAGSRQDRLQHKKPRRSAAAKAGNDRTGNDRAASSDESLARVRPAQVVEAALGESADALARRGTGDGATSDQENSDSNAEADAAETTEDPRARPGRTGRRASSKPAGKTLATRRLLAVIAAEWKERVAAFGFPWRDAPPKAYCPTDFAEAYALTAAERRALPKEQIRRLNVKAGPLVARGLEAAHVFDEWRDAMVQLPVDIRRVDQVGTYARAFSHADTLVYTSFEVLLPHFVEPGETLVLTPQQRLQRLVELTRRSRARLTLEARAWMDLGAIPVGALKNLKGGSGHYNAATDVLALVEVLRSAAATGAHVRLTELDLERCAVLAYTLIEATSRQSTKRGGEAQALALEERERALTLLWLAFCEGRHALQHIFGARLPVNVVLPTLSAGVGRKRGR